MRFSYKVDMMYIIDDIPSFDSDSVVLIPITLVNSANDKVVSFSVSTEEEWLSLDATEGSCSDIDPFILTASASGLAAGTHVGTITFVPSDSNCTDSEGFEIQVNLSAT